MKFAIWALGIPLVVLLAAFLGPAASRALDLSGTPAGVGVSALVGFALGLAYVAVLILTDD